MHWTLIFVTSVCLFFLRLFLHTSFFQMELKTTLLNVICPLDILDFLADTVIHLVAL